ncbi:MAG: hypothetical protein AMJ58_06760 [Gammaproteobacteria bacterium SG8_30]|nr:MAG: hypothetical protein AMJ58_06760 [Gammaproteobacteria bacterium SG8_30]
MAPAPAGHPCGTGFRVGRRPAPEEFASSPVPRHGPGQLLQHPRGDRFRGEGLRNDAFDALRDAVGRSQGQYRARQLLARGDGPGGSRGCPCTASWRSSGSGSGHKLPVAALA